MRLLRGSWAFSHLLRLVVHRRLLFPNSYTQFLFNIYSTSFCVCIRFTLFPTISIHLTHSSHSTLNSPFFLFLFCPAYDATMTTINSTRLCVFCSQYSNTENSSSMSTLSFLFTFRQNFEPNNYESFVSRISALGFPSPEKVYRCSQHDTTIPNNSNSPKWSPMLWINSTGNSTPIVFSFIIFFSSI